MYFLDPDHGRRRRALTRDQFVHAGRVLRDLGHAAVRDAAHRVCGLFAEARRRLRHDDVPDEVLNERVRAVLGRVVSHPHAIRVSSSRGTVTLAGPILEDEVSLLMSSVRRVPGVKSVEQRLEVHDEPGNIPSLQGGWPRTGDRFELLQDQWAPSIRVLMGVLGAGLMASAFRRRGLPGALFAAAGGGLVARSTTNLDFASLFGVGTHRRGITVQKAISIDAPVEQVFEFWSNYQNFPRFMSRVLEVRPLGDNRSHWVVAGPAGTKVEWVSETTRMIPNRLIEWQCLRGSGVRHWGVVRFDPVNGGTRVGIRMSYVPVGGAIGHALACLAGSDPKSEMNADLMRMKTLIETGRPPHDAARPGPVDVAARKTPLGSGHPPPSVH